MFFGSIVVNGLNGFDTTHNVVFVKVVCIWRLTEKKLISLKL